MELNRPLHGLRGAAALTVVIGHYGIVQGAASLGVVLFFILSGYLIGAIYLEKNFDAAGVRSYIVARFARVYPLFALVVIGVGGLGYFHPPANVFFITPAQVFQNLILLGENMTIWTISTEFQFYLFFVALWWTRSKAGSTGRVVWPAFAISVAVSTLWSVHESRTGLPGYLHIFMVGIALSMAPRSFFDKWRATSNWLLPLAVVAYFAVYITTPLYQTNEDIYMNPMAIIVCLVLLLGSLSANNSIFNRILGSSPMVLAGEISFGIYLLHRPAAWFVDATMREIPLGAAYVAKLVLTIAASYAAFIIIERPARDTLRQVFDRKRSAPAF